MLAARRLGLTGVLGLDASPPSPPAVHAGFVLTAHPPDQERSPEMAHIMAVDDSVSLRQLLVRTLIEGGHRVMEAKDGVEALSAAATQKFQLVITDVNMPQMDGLTLVKKLRELPAYKHIPILVLTTEMDPNKKKIAKDAGATGWLVKPFEPVQLLATIRKVLD